VQIAFDPKISEWGNLSFVGMKETNQKLGLLTGKLKHESTLSLRPLRRREKERIINQLAEKPDSCTGYLAFYLVST